MKLIRNSLFAMYLDYKISMRLNPVLTTLLTGVTVICAVAVLKIFGL